MIRLIGYFFGIGTMLALLAAAGIAVFIGNLAKDLPDYEVLAKYEPPVTTRVHASDGALMAEFARERRLYIPIQAVPDRVKAAFLSAEDKNFYNHPGIDITGLGRAIMVNVQNLGSGRRPVGASTITQQVAKNFLLSSDQTVERKIKEMILDAGAAEVHFRIASPPTAWPCFYGVDTPQREKLLAATMSEDEMCEHLAVDSLRFISLDGLYRAVGEAEGRNAKCPQYCDACFSGEYPVTPADKVKEGFKMKTAAE